jgi:hypothetical protein
VPIIDADAVVQRYRDAVFKMHERVDVLRNEPEDLDELVRRLAGRIPPASAAGEEARDVLIWLAAKRRSAAGALALISGDKGIIGSGGGLRHELQGEIAAGGAAAILANPTLDAFLARHHARTSFITEAWLHERVGAQDCLDAIDEFLDDHEQIFRGDVEDLGEPTVSSDSNS